MEKKANRGPGFQSFCLEFATHGISMVNKEDPGFDNYYLNLEAALFFGSLFKSL